MAGMTINGRPGRVSMYLAAPDIWNRLTRKKNELPHAGKKIHLAGYPGLPLNLVKPCPVPRDIPERISLRARTLPPQGIRDCAPAQARTVSTGGARPT